MHKTMKPLATIAALMVAASAVLVACTDKLPTEISRLAPDAKSTMLKVSCTASVIQRSVSCGDVSLPGGAKGVLMGDQNVHIKLTSSNVSYDSGTGIFQFDVTVQNLMNEGIGMLAQAYPDPDGIRVFFNSGPTATNGTGVVSVANSDGFATYTSANQPYFEYSTSLNKDEVSFAKTWQLNVPSTVTQFDFTVLLATETEYKLVINEVLVNPAGTTIETTGEWFELYNAGSLPVDMQNLVIADSAASGRRPYHLISSSLVVQPGGYVVLGETANTLSNGGVTVDYAYGSALQLANSLDAVKIARVFGTDTVTIDRTQYANATTSAQDGISRELKNPAFDNSNMDGSNWSAAVVTAVYGTGGRGTPGAQNSTFTPNLVSTDNPGLPIPIRANKPLRE